MTEQKNQKQAMESEQRLGEATDETAGVEVGATSEDGEPRSVFAGASEEMFKTYTATLQFRDKLLGGVPNDPNIIEGWLRTKMGITQRRELAQMTAQTILERDPETEITAEAILEMDEDEAFALMAETAQKGAENKVNGFKQDATHGLYIESRIVKAMIKENAATLFPGRREDKKPAAKWGPTAKGAKSLVAERVFVRPDLIPLGRNEPDGIEQIIGHVQGRSMISLYEYVLQPRVTFDILVAEDMVPHVAWPRLFALAQENGLGASRSQGHGTFDVIEWSG